MSASWQKEEDEVEKMLLYLDQKNMINVQEMERAVTGKTNVVP